MKYLNGKKLEDYKTWEEVEKTLKGILNNPLLQAFGLVTDRRKPVNKIFKEYKEEWDKLHKVERKEDESGVIKAIDKLSDDIDIKEISKPITKINNEIQVCDKVIIIDGLFKNLIGEVGYIDDELNIINYVVKMSDGNMLNIPETNLKLYEKAECNLPKSKEELRDNMDKKIFDTIGNVKVIIEPRKTKVQLMNGIFGDTSFGYEDKNYNKEENIRIAYIHAIRHYCKVLLYEEINKPLPKEKEIVEYELLLTKRQKKLLEDYMKEMHIEF